MRNTLERARFAAGTRIVSSDAKNLSKKDLMLIEAEDILQNRVFNDPDAGGIIGMGSQNGAYADPYRRWGRFRCGHRF